MKKTNQSTYQCRTHLACFAPAQSWRTCPGTVVCNYHQECHVCENICTNQQCYICMDIYRVSQKSSPPVTFNDIFAWAESFCIKFKTFIGNLYQHMSTDYRLFILTFNEMALILLRAPTNFTVSSFDCSAMSLL